MRFLSDLWAAFVGVFRRDDRDSEPDSVSGPGASATLELSRTDIEIISD